MMMLRASATWRPRGWLARAGATPLAPEVEEKAAICFLGATGLAILVKGETTARAARSAEEMFVSKFCGALPVGHIVEATT